MTWEIYYYEYNYFSAPGFKEYYFSHFFYITLARPGIEPNRTWFLSCHILYKLNDIVCLV